MSLTSEGIDHDQPPTPPPAHTTAATEAVKRMFKSLPTEAFPAAALDTGELEADADIAAGRVMRFSNVEDAIAWLRSDDDDPPAFAELACQKCAYQGIVNCEPCPSCQKCGCRCKCLGDGLEP